MRRPSKYPRIQRWEPPLRTMRQLGEPLPRRPQSPHASLKSKKRLEDVSRRKRSESASRRKPRQSANACKRSRMIKQLRRQPLSSKRRKRRLNSLVRRLKRKRENARG